MWLIYQFYAEKHLDTMYYLMRSVYLTHLLCLHSHWLSLCNNCSLFCNFLYSFLEFYDLEINLDYRNIYFKRRLFLTFLLLFIPVYLGYAVLTIIAIISGLMGFLDKYVERKVRFCDGLFITLDQ